MKNLAVKDLLLVLQDAQSKIETLAYLLNEMIQEEDQKFDSSEMTKEIKLLIGKIQINDKLILTIK